MCVYSFIESIAVMCYSLAVDEHEFTMIYIFRPARLPTTRLQNK